MQRGFGSFYFGLNPDSVDTGGLLKNDWATPNDGKVALLKRLPATSVVCQHVVVAQGNGGTWTVVLLGGLDWAAMNAWVLSSTAEGHRLGTGVVYGETAHFCMHAGVGAWRSAAVPGPAASATSTSPASTATTPECDVHGTLLEAAAIANVAIAAATAVVPNRRSRANAPWGLWNHPRCNQTGGDADTQGGSAGDPR